MGQAVERVPISYESTEFTGKVNLCIYWKWSLKKLNIVSNNSFRPHPRREPHDLSLVLLHLPSKFSSKIKNSCCCGMSFRTCKSLTYYLTIYFIIFTKSLKKIICFIWYFFFWQQFIINKALDFIKYNQ